MLVLLKRMAESLAMKRILLLRSRSIEWKPQARSSTWLCTDCMRARFKVTSEEITSSRTTFPAMGMREVLVRGPRAENSPSFTLMIGRIVSAEFCFGWVKEKPRTRAGLAVRPLLMEKSGIVWTGNSRKVVELPSVDLSGLLVLNLEGGAGRLAYVMERTREELFT